MLKEIEQFVNWVRRRNAGARTWRDYRYDLKQFVQVVGDHPPDRVTFHEVDRFVIQQAQRGYQAATINRRLATSAPQDATADLLAQPHPSAALAV